MKKLHLGAILTAVAFGALAPPVSAQGISGMLDRIATLENRAQRMEGDAAEQRQPVDSPGDVAAVGATIQVLDERLAQLEARVASLVATRRDNARPIVEMADLLEALRALVVEARALAQEYRRQDADVVPTDPSSVSVSSTASGAEPAAPDEAPGEDEGTASGGPGGFTITGFVDGSYFLQDDAPDPSTFGMDQVELRLARKFGERGSLQVDLESVVSGHKSKSDNWLRTSGFSGV